MTGKRWLWLKAWRTSLWLCAFLPIFLPVALSTGWSQWQLFGWGAIVAFNATLVVYLMEREAIRRWVEEP